MSKRRLKQNPGQQKAKRAPQPIANDIATCKVDTVSPVSVGASKTSAELLGQDTKHIKTTHSNTVIATSSLVLSVISLIVAGLALYPSFQQAKSAQEANDRAAGRLPASAKILGVIPSIEKLKQLFIPLDPPMLDVYTRKPTSVPRFRDLRALCQTNPRLHVKNTGDQTIGAVRIEVEEKSVMPFGPGDQITIPDPSDPKKPAVIRYKPLLDPTVGDNCDLGEKLKPGDEAIIPIWRPLIRAMLKAQKVKSQSGQYKGTFEVRCYVQGVNTPAFDSAEGSVPLGFVWSAEGFTEEGFKRIQHTPSVVKVLKKNQDPAKAMVLEIAL